MTSKLQFLAEQNTMKNTAPRVGVAGGAGGRRTRPPREAQGRKPRAGQGATLAPRARQKMCARGGRSGREAGRQTSGYRTEGKPPDTLLAKHRASRKKRSAATTAVPSEARAPQGRARWRGGRPRRRSPTRATAPQGGKAHTTRRAIMLRQAAMGAKDNRQQGNKSGGTRNRHRPTERPSRSGSDGTTRAEASPHDRRSETSYRAGRRAPPARRRSRGDARAPPSLSRRPRRMASTSDRHRIAIASPSDRSRSSVRVTRGRARSVRACAADHLCLSGFRLISVCYLWENACRIY